MEVVYDVVWNFWLVLLTSLILFQGAFGMAGWRATPQEEPISTPIP